MSDYKRNKVYLYSKQYHLNIINTLQEAIIIIDLNYRIVDANKPACTRFNREQDNLVGLHCYEISHAFGRPCFEVGMPCPFKKVLETGQEAWVVHEHKRPGGMAVWEEILAAPLRDKKDNIAFVIEEIRDVTELLRTKEVIHHFNKKIKVLRRFIPICASCKRIRIDNGNWEDIEDYIQEHSEADFTHTICPKCQRKLYPEF